MFQDHYGLHDDPFALGPNLRFLFRSNAHAETMAHLGFGLEQGEDIVMISGAIGTGKTLALQNLQAKVSRLFRQVLVNVTKVDFRGFLKLVLHELEVSWPERADVADLLVLLKDAALRCHADGRKILLVVDEAQNLGTETLEGIRLLSNIGQPDKQVFQIILAGQLALEDVVNRPELAQLRQRIRIHYRLESLTREETGEYIAHRLAVAGCEEPLFTPAAVKRIHEISGGVPRLVNHLAGHALLVAFVDKARKVDEKHVASEGMPEPPQPAAGGVPGAEPVRPSRPDVVVEPAMPSEPEPALAPPPRQAKPEPPAPEPEPEAALVPPEPVMDEPDDRLPPPPTPRLNSRRSGTTRPQRRFPVWGWAAIAIVVVVAGGWYYLREEGRQRGGLQARAASPTTTGPAESVVEQPMAVAAGAQPETAVAAADQIWLHVASFRDDERAGRYRDLLVTAGVSVEIRPVELAGGERWLRVLVGPVADAATAEAISQDLESQGLITFHRTLP